VLELSPNSRSRRVDPGAILGLPRPRSWHFPVISPRISSAFLRLSSLIEDDSRSSSKKVPNLHSYVIAKNATRDDEKMLAKKHA